MTIPTNIQATSFAISDSGAPSHDWSVTPWGRRIATEDERRSEELAAIFRRNRAPRERKTNIGDVHGALRVVSHLPKSGSHSRVLVTCDLRARARAAVPIRVASMARRTGYVPRVPT